MHMQNMHSNQSMQTLDTVRHLTAGRLQRYHGDTIAQQPFAHAANRFWSVVEFGLFLDY